MAADQSSPRSTACCTAKAISSESVVEVNSACPSSTNSRNSRAFTRLPLWAKAKAPSRVINTTGWALHTRLLPVVE